MAVTLLISKSDFAPYVDVATNLQDVKLNPRILEAQTFDLRPLLGMAMYGDIFVNPDTYTALLPYLKPSLVYFSAARLIKSLDLHITPNGVMTKRNEFSDHVDTKAIAYQAVQYQNLAIAYWNEANTYINDNPTLYPLYIGFEKCKVSTSDVRSKIFGIGGRDLNGYR